MEAWSFLQPPGAPIGQWQHLAIIYDPVQGQNTMYLDGVLAAAAPTLDTMLSNSDPLDIGARQFQGGYTLPWTGALDDVRIYNRAITPLEARALAYQGHPPKLNAVYTGGQLTLSWPFEAIGYELQLAPAPNAPDWTNVPGVTTNSFTLTPPSGTGFYRLHRK